MKPQSKLIIQIRTESKCACHQLSLEELKDGLKVFIARVCVISGIIYPQSESLYNYLISEIIVLLRKSKFNSISLEEMVLAFRINSQCDWKYSSGEDVETIEIFGNHISVHYIAKVLSNYVLLRSGVEKEIGNIIDGY